MGKGVTIGIFIVLAIILVVMIFTGFNITGNVIKDPNTDSRNTSSQVCKDVQVPYDYIEEYQETEPYIENIPLKYTGQETNKYNCGEIGNYKVCYEISIYNLDTVGGIFGVTCNIKALNREFSASDSGYIKPGEIGKLICGADVDWGEDNKLLFDVTPPTKPETQYREVTRQRTVTRYRTEQQCS